jgi:outer membrane protein assembly factor BamB
MLPFVVGALSAPLHADWTQFRGHQGRGVAQDATRLPIEWDRQANRNIAWRVDLPGRGPSSPIVIGDRVVVTCSSGYQQDRLHVVCFDAGTGDTLWHRQFWATGRTRTHPTSANAAPTPASDGQAVYAFYSSNDLACLDLDGNLRWYRGLAYDFPKAGNDVGMSSSPVVAENVVVVQVENQGDSFISGIDTRTGETRWQFARPKVANWSSPLITQAADGAMLVLFTSGQGLDAHDLQSGALRWSFPSPAGGIPSVAALPGQIYLPANGLTALELKRSDATPEVLWTSNRLNPGSASPVIADDRIYSINGAGVLVCANRTNGELEWQLRLQGKFWATPVLVGGHLYCFNDAGLAQVVKIGEKKGEIVASNDFAESVLGSPAVGPGALFVRTDTSLWKVAVTP